LVGLCIAETGLAEWLLKCHHPLERETPMAKDVKTVGRKRGGKGKDIDSTLGGLVELKPVGQQKEQHRHEKREHPVEGKWVKVRRRGGGKMRTLFVTRVVTTILSNGM